MKLVLNIVKRTDRRNRKHLFLNHQSSLGIFRTPVSYFPGPDRQLEETAYFTLHQESTQGIPKIINLHQQDGSVHFTYPESPLNEPISTLLGSIISLFYSCLADAYIQTLYVLPWFRYNSSPAKHCHLSLASIFNCQIKYGSHV